VTRKRTNLPTRAVPGPADGIVEPLSLFLRWARLQLHQRIINATGVTVDRSAIVILETLHRDGPMRMSELAGKIHLDRSTVSRQVAAVITTGLLEKTEDANDARAAVLSLTARGQAVRQKVAIAWHAIAVELVATWSYDEQIEFGRLLSKLAQQLGDVGRDAKSFIAVRP
jgi:DNA-binding MarR family transcriptional regulator